MSTLIRSAATSVWALLMTLTIASYVIGEDQVLGLSRETASIAIMIVAVVKVRFVVRHFMEMRHAPLPLRLAFEAWGLGVVLSTVGIYVLA